MKEREMGLAERYGISEKCQRLEQHIMSINGATGVEYDLSGFLDGIKQVIVLVGYDYSRISFRNLAREVVRIADECDLNESGDRIEDYGEHAYFVFDCGVTWLKKPRGGGMTVRELVGHYEAKTLTLDRRIKSLRSEERMFRERAQELREHANRAEKKADAVHEALDNLQSVDWVDTVVRPLAEEIAKLKGKEARLLGPVGIGSKVTIYLSDNEETSWEEREFLTVEPDFGGKALVLRYETGQYTERYQKGSLGELSGLNAITEPLPDSIEEIAELFRVCGRSESNDGRV